jgi:hypothetical protein
VVKEAFGADNLLELALSLNKYAGEYKEQTVKIQALLACDDEDSIFKIQDVLNRREALIKRYNKTSGEFKLEYSGYTNSGQVPMEINATFNYLEQERQDIFHSIKDVDNRNLEKISELFNHSRGHIRQIEQGKKLMNAYQSAPHVSDGIFFDRRK